MNDNDGPQYNVGQVSWIPAFCSGRLDDRSGSYCKVRMFAARWVIKDYSDRYLSSDRLLVSPELDLKVDACWNLKLQLNPTLLEPGLLQERQPVVLNYDSKCENINPFLAVQVKGCKTARKMLASAKSASQANDRQASKSRLWKKWLKSVFVEKDELITVFSLG